MNEIAKLLLSLSLAGSILAILIFVMKPFIKNKLSKSIQYYIWIVVLLRLTLPFSFEASIMNELFYGSQKPAVTTTESVVLPKDVSVENGTNSSIFPNVKEIVANGVYNADPDHSSYFEDIFNQYALYVWLLGVIITLAINLIGYARFSKHLKQTNKSATDQENIILASLFNRRNNLRLARNRFVTTPILIGIIRPYIIIPDIKFNEQQLKNILLHEITHYRRFDIGVKWLTMIATSIHWFNPFMYFLKKEINHACELACDEAVIKNLSQAEKQFYGETLISVVAEDKYPIGVLQATMCEEKNSLKERLVAIMSHNKKSKLIIIISTILFISVIAGAIYLGAGVGIGKDIPPEIYISTEREKTKQALMASYAWEYRGNKIEADSDHPINFEYKSANSVTAAAEEQLIIGTQKLKSDKNYDFTIKQISVYKDDKLIEVEIGKQGFMNGDLYIQAPPESGEYIFVLELEFEDRGSVNYGFAVMVDMLSFDLTEISKYKTAFIGDNSKVSAIAGHLPVPDRYFEQRFTSMETTEKPYKLTLYYEAFTDIEYEGEWPIATPDSAIEKKSRTNALVVFAMIDNLDEVTFAYRISQSNGELDTEKYDTAFTFQRAFFEEKYGDLTMLGENLDLLQEALTE